MWLPKAEQRFFVATSFLRNQTVVNFINLLRLISQTMSCSKYEVNHFSEESVMT